MWTPEDRRLVGGHGAGQALSDDQYRLRAIFADSIYNRMPVILACFLLGLTPIIAHRIAGGGFILVPHRWVVERSFGWFGKWRRLSKDYEERTDIAEVMVTLAAIRIMLHRLVQPNRRRLPAPDL